jgi:hypothetical protein
MPQSAYSLWGPPKQIIGRHCGWVPASQSRPLRSSFMANSTCCSTLSLARSQACTAGTNPIGAGCATNCTPPSCSSRGWASVRSSPQVTRPQRCWFLPNASSPASPRSTPIASACAPQAHFSAFSLWARARLLPQYLRQQPSRSLLPRRRAHYFLVPPAGLKPGSGKNNREG